MARSPACRARARVTRLKPVWRGGTPGDELAGRASHRRGAGESQAGRASSRQLRPAYLQWIAYLHRTKKERSLPVSTGNDSNATLAMKSRASPGLAGLTGTSAATEKGIDWRTDELKLTERP
jgi:hypothetical protein